MPMFFNPNPTFVNKTGAVCLLIITYYLYCEQIHKKNTQMSYLKIEILRAVQFTIYGITVLSNKDFFSIVTSHGSRTGEILPPCEAADTARYLKFRT